MTRRITAAIFSMLVLFSYSDALEVIEVNNLDRELVDKANLTVFANPIGVLYGIANIGVELRQHQFFSLTPTLYAGFIDRKIKGDTVQGYGMGVGVRHYDNLYELKGMFFEIGYIYGSVDVKATADEGNALYHMPSILAGYRWNGGKFVFELGLGIGYFLADVESDLTGERWITSSTVPLFNVGTGFMF